VRALLVPLKSFAQAKARLSPSLDKDARVLLIKRLATRVLLAAGALPAFIVCDDGGVADWSIGQGASALYAPGLGLNGAVTAGVELLGRMGFGLIVVAHADLPFVDALDRFGADDEVTIAPDRRDDGTNVIALPSAASFHFFYGPGSFNRHRLEADRLGLRSTVVRDPRFATDVDLPADLAEFGESLFAASADAALKRAGRGGE
jgi:2-phospho-L-lactate/phosphoenolpyruvate guanylyltransferase